MQIFAPTYTQTPNDLFDHWLPFLGEVELKVLLTIIRKTFGWHKISDNISISQLEKATGSSPQNIGNATKSLISKGLISKEVIGPRGKQETHYALIVNADSNNSYPSQSVSPPPDKLLPPPLINYQSQKKSPKEIEKQQDDVLTAPVAPLEKSESSKDFPGQSGADMYTLNMIDGTQIQISGGDVYTAAVMKNKDWTQEEIRVALQKVKTSDVLIRDWVSYIDGIIKNNRSQERAKPKKVKRESKQTPPIEEERTERPVVDRDTDPGRKYALEYNERLRSSGFEVFAKLADRNAESLKSKYLLVYTKRDDGSFGIENVGYHNLFVSQWEGINSVFDEILEKKHTQKG